MDERKINRKLSEYCKETCDSIRNRELFLAKLPIQFTDYKDAAACNQQYKSDFDQEQAIKLAILKWGRKILQHIAINTPIKFNDLVGMYMEINVQLPFETFKNFFPMKYAMFEVTDLFDKGHLTLPLATRILIAGLQNVLHQRSLQMDDDIKLLIVSLNNAISGVSLPYQKAHVPITL